jgi:hypothetical protein
VVVLVDEYDKPIIDHWGKAAALEARGPTTIMTILRAQRRDITAILRLCFDGIRA